MNSKKIKKILTNILLCNCTLNIVGCKKADVEELTKIIEQRDEIWEKTLEILSQEIDCSELSEENNYGEAINYIYNEKNIDKTVKIELVNPELKTQPLQNNINQFLASIKYKNNFTNKTIKLIKVKSYADIIDIIVNNLDFNNLGLTSAHTYEEFLNRVLKQIKNQNVKVDLENQNKDEKFNSGNNTLNIKFYYQINNQDVKATKIIPIEIKIRYSEVEKIFKQSLVSLDKTIKNWSTDNTYQQLFDEIQNRIHNLKDNTQKVDFKKVKLTFKDQNNYDRINEYLPDSIQEVNFKVEYEHYKSEIAIEFKEFKLSEIDQARNSVDTISILTTSDTFEDILTNIKENINNKDIEISFVEKNIELKDNLVVGTNKYNISFKLNNIIKNKFITVTDVDTLDNILNREVKLIDDIFDTKLTWNQNQTYNEILDKVRANIANKRIKAEFDEKEKINLEDKINWEDESKPIKVTIILKFFISEAEESSKPVILRIRK